MSNQLYFMKPESVNIGDLVWYYRSDVLIGPLLVIDYRRTGYGIKGQEMWIMHDSTTGDYHQSRTIWLRVPKEAPCD